VFVHGREIEDFDREVLGETRNRFWPSKTRLVPGRPGTSLSFRIPSACRSAKSETGFSLDYGAIGAPSSGRLTLMIVEGTPGT
jgi:hypothetical protein